jgi:Predicted amidohydrolase
VVKMRIALIQMESSQDKQQNLEASLMYMEEALKYRPEVVVFPEYQMHLPDFERPELTLAAAEPANGEFVAAFLEKQGAKS